METLPQTEEIVKETTPDEAAASLAFATNLSERFLMPQMMPMDAPESPETAPERENMGEMMDEPTAKKEEPDVDFRAEMETIRNEVKSAVKEEISGLRTIIEQALNEEGD